jgi:hypothetical protein
VGLGCGVVKMEAFQILLDFVEGVAVLHEES